MEDSDYEMTRITTELLAENPGGNLDELRTIVKTTESSNWYKPGIKGRAKSNPGRKWSRRYNRGRKMVQ